MGKRGRAVKQGNLEFCFKMWRYEEEPGYKEKMLRVLEQLITRSGGLVTLIISDKGWDSEFILKDLTVQTVREVLDGMLLAVYGRKEMFSEDDEASGQDVDVQIKGVELELDKYPA